MISLRQAIRPGMEYNHLSVVPGNQKAKDYAIGDLHANLDILYMILAELEEEDRLFLVGDLLDGKLNNLETLKVLIAIDKHKPGSIYSVRGNHDQMALRHIQGLETAGNRLSSIQIQREAGKSPRVIFPPSEEDTPANSEKLAGAASSIARHIKNGGEWLLNLFQAEVADNLITWNERSEVTYQPGSRVKQIRDYFRLPFITHIQGNDQQMPHNLVHADTHCNDETLKPFLNAEDCKTFFINATQQEYCMWARRESAPKIVPPHLSGKHPGNIPTIVGHNVVQMGLNPAYDHATNTINLNTGLKTGNVAILYCITDCTIRIIGEPKAVADYMANPFKQRALAQYYEMSEKLALYRALFIKLKNCHELNKIHELIMKACLDLQHNIAYYEPLDCLSIYCQLSVFAENTSAITEHQRRRLFWQLVERTPNLNPSKSFELVQRLMTKGHLSDYWLIEPPDRDSLNSTLLCGQSLLNHSLFKTSKTAANDADALRPPTSPTP